MRRAVERRHTIGQRQEAALGAFVPSPTIPTYAEDDARAGRLQFINNRTILHGRAHPRIMRRRIGGVISSLWINVPGNTHAGVASTLVAADMARWDAQAAQRRAATPAGRPDLPDRRACCRFHLAYRRRHP
jgi:hypothetical protein